jgi:hypothetical protein
VIEDYPYFGINFSSDPDVPMPPREERGEIGNIFFKVIYFFNCFYIYHFYVCIRVLTFVYLLCKYVGPVFPMDFTRTRRRPQIEVGPTTTGEPIAAGGPVVGEAERVLRWVECNLTMLTCTIPMDEIKNLPPSMQPQVVGVPQTWVQLFRRLANTVFHYGRANRPQT